MDAKYIETFENTAICMSYNGMYTADVLTRDTPNIMGDYLKALQADTLDGIKELITEYRSK